MTILDETYLCTFNTNQKMVAGCDLDQEIGAIHFVPRSVGSIMIQKPVTFKEQLKYLISPITFLLPKRVKLVKK